MQEPWAVVYAKPACEFLAAKAIVEAGYRSYCPARRETLRGHRPGRGAVVIRPLFPRYLFAEYHPGAAAALLHCTGVSELLRKDCGQGIATLPAGAVEELRDRERNLEFDEASEAPRFLPQPGQRVRIVGGAWSRMLATVAELDGERRALAMLRAFAGREVRTWVPVEMMEPV